MHEAEALAQERDNPLLRLKKLIVSSVGESAKKQLVALERELSLRMDELDAKGSGVSVPEACCSAVVDPWSVVSYRS